MKWQGGGEESEKNHKKVTIRDRCDELLLGLSVDGKSYSKNV